MLIQTVKQQSHYVNKQLWEQFEKKIPNIIFITV